MSCGHIFCTDSTYRFYLQSGERANSFTLNSDASLPNYMMLHQQIVVFTIANIKVSKLKRVLRTYQHCNHVK